MAGPVPSLAERFAAKAAAPSPSLAERFAAKAQGPASLADRFQRKIDAEYTIERAVANTGNTFNPTPLRDLNPQPKKVTDFGGDVARDEQAAADAGLERMDIGKNQWTGGRTAESGWLDPIWNAPARVLGAGEAVGSGLAQLLGEAAKTYQGEESKGQKWGTPDYKKPDIQARLRDPRKLLKSILGGHSPTEQEDAPEEKLPFWPALGRDMRHIGGAVAEIPAMAEQLTDRTKPIGERGELAADVTRGLIRYPGEAASKIIADPWDQATQHPLTTTLDVLGGLGSVRGGLRKGAAKALTKAEKLEGGAALFDETKVIRPKQAKLEVGGEFREAPEALRMADEAAQNATLQADLAKRAKRNVGRQARDGRASAIDDIQQNLVAEHQRAGTAFSADEIRARATAMLDADPAYQATRARMDTRRATLRAEAKAARKEAKAAGETAEGVKKSVVYDTKATPRGDLSPGAASLVQKAENLEAAANAVDKLMYWGNPLLAPFRLADEAIWAAIKSKRMRPAPKMNPKTGAMETPWWHGSKLQFWYGSPGDPRAAELATYYGHKRMAAGEVSAFKFDAEQKMAAIPKADQPTLFEGLHMEDLSFEPYIERAMDKAPGERFTLKQLPDDPELAAAVQRKIEVANLHDKNQGFYDWLRDQTRRSQEARLLDPMQTRDEVWKPNVYMPAAHKEARIQQIMGRGVSREVAVQRVANQDILEVAREASPSLSGVKVKGLGEKSRDYGHVPIEERVSKMGMSKDLGETIWVRYMDQEADIARSRMHDRLAEDPSIYSVVPKEGWVAVHNAPVSKYGARKFGTKLPETFYVHPDVHWDIALNEYMATSATNGRFSWLSGLIQFFKKVHTSYNPGTQFTNFVGNALMLAPMAGMNPMNPANWRYFKQAAQEFALGAKGAAYREWATSRPFGAGERTRAEIPAAVLRTYGDHMGGAINHGKDVVRATFDLAKTIIGRGEGKESLFRIGRLIKDLPTMVYAANDEWWKFATHLKYRAQGMDVVKAAAKAEHAYGDFNALSGMTRVISAAPLGSIPFIAFTARMSSRLNSFMLENPGRGALLMGIWELLIHENEKRSHVSAERDAQLPKGLPAWARHRLTMARSIHPDLERDDAGLLNFFDSLKYVPGGQFIPQGDEGFVEMAKRTIRGSNPLTATSEAALGNWDPAMKREVWSEFDSPELALKKFGKRFARTMVPLGEVYAQMAPALRGDVKPGRDVAVSPARAAAQSLLGVRTVGYSEQELLDRPHDEERAKLFSKHFPGARGHFKRLLTNFEEGKGDVRTVPDLAREIRYLAENHLGDDVDEQIKDLRAAVKSRLKAIAARWPFSPRDEKERLDAEKAEVGNDIKAILESPDWTAQNPAQQETSP